jgi:stage II sporulation protein AA (anti-sigma F factor antagonist)
VDQGGTEAAFSAATEVDGDHLLVVVAGEVDMSTAGAMIDATTEEKARRLTLDLRQVTFFDSAAIHAVVQLADRFADGLAVLPSRQVRRVLEISGLGDQPWLRPD